MKLKYLVIHPRLFNARAQKEPVKISG